MKKACSVSPTNQSTAVNDGCMSDQTSGIIAFQYQNLNYSSMLVNCFGSINPGFTLFHSNTCNSTGVYVGQSGCLEVFSINGMPTELGVFCNNLLLNTTLPSTNATSSPTALPTFFSPSISPSTLTYPPTPQLMPMFVGIAGGDPHYITYNKELFTCNTGVNSWNLFAMGGNPSINWTLYTYHAQYSPSSRATSINASMLYLAGSSSSLQVSQFEITVASMQSQSGNIIYNAGTEFELVITNQTISLPNFESTTIFVNIFGSQYLTLAVMSPLIFGGIIVEGCPNDNFVAPSSFECTALSGIAQQICNYDMNLTNLDTAFVQGASQIMYYLNQFNAYFQNPTASAPTGAFLETGSK